VPKTALAPGTLPACSIIIPTRGRPRLLTECLQSIAESDYPTGRLEVIVVDDSGSFGDKGVADVRKRLDLSILRSRDSGPAAARNAGAARAAGEILAFTDDDCRVTRRWLRRLVRVIGGNGELAAGGHTVNALKGNRWSAASQRIIDVVYHFYNDKNDGAAFLTTNNLAVPARAFHEVGGFDATFRTAEDRDFCRRWRMRGLELKYEPDALVLHAHPLTFVDFVRQHFDYGRGAFRYHLGSNTQGYGQLRTFTGFYRSLPRLLQTTEPDKRATLGANLVDLAVWQAANTAGFAWEAIKTLGVRADR
jgi:GT2 family glycosyltransferase